MVVDKDTLLLFVNWGKYFNRIQKLAVQMPKVKQNCPKLYAIMQGIDKDQVHQGHIVHDGGDLNGYCMTVTVQESLPIISCFTKDVLNAVEILLNKNLNIYNELNGNPPFLGWKQGLEEVWN